MRPATPDVFLNGSFLERTDARLSAFDAGLQHAVGLFETMRAEIIDGKARVARLGRHLDRLAESAKALALTETLNRAALAEAVEQTVTTAGHSPARVRLTLTGGDLNMLGSPGQQHDPTVLIESKPATTYPAEMYSRGVMASIADTRANPLNAFEGHKTLNYWWRLRELQIAASKGAAEALVFTVSNHLAGGCVSNAILIKDDALFTPIARTEEQAGAIASPVLPGVTRSAVLDAAEGIGLDVRKRMLTIDDVLDADELWLTNSSWGMLPVTAVERSKINDGNPGTVGTKLRDAIVD